MPSIPYTYAFHLSALKCSPITIMVHNASKIPYKPPFLNFQLFCSCVHILVGEGTQINNKQNFTFERISIYHSIFKEQCKKSHLNHHDTNQILKVLPHRLRTTIYILHFPEDVQFPELIFTTCSM